MKQSLQIQIPEPCHESWDNMTPAAQGRFCGACRKSVVDFSVMSDKEILDYISNAGGNICGRVHNDQLNRMIASQPVKKQYSFRYFWSLLITSFLITEKSDGQVKVPKEKIVCTNPNIQVPAQTGKVMVGGISTVSKKTTVKMELSGRIVDDRNLPLSFASVSLRDSHKGVAADSSGNFIFPFRGTIDDVNLAISSVGYKTTLVELLKGDHLKSVSVENGAMKINLGEIILKEQPMGEVIVVGGLYSRRTSGGLSVCYKRTVIDKIKDTLQSIVSPIKVYPNPVAVNTTFNIQFDIKQPGEYTIQFFDASGKLVYSQRRNIAAKGQTESFNGSMFTAHGIYFAKVFSAVNNKTYTTRLLVQ